jgi:hypothetical protein
MKQYTWAVIVLSTIILASCSSSKTYFTQAIREDVERSNVDMKKIQFYADRDIVLKRELDNGEVKVTSGKVQFENGHYVNVITLKKGTPGVCTFLRNDVVGISFEEGNDKFLTFGKTKRAQASDPYRILANDWVRDYGVIQYEGKSFHIEPAGTEAAILIKSKWIQKTKVESREMKGRKVAS